MGRTSAVRSPYEEQIATGDDAAMAAADEAQRAEVEGQRQAQAQGFPNVAGLAEYGRKLNEKKLELPLRTAEAQGRAQMDRLLTTQDQINNRQQVGIGARTELQDDQQAARAAAAGVQKQVRPTDKVLGSLAQARAATQGFTPITSLQRGLHKMAPSMFGKASADTASDEALLNVMRSSGSYDMLNQVAGKLRSGEITPQDLQELDPDEREAVALILERGGQ